MLGLRLWSRYSALGTDLTVCPSTLRAVSGVCATRRRYALAYHTKNAPGLMSSMRHPLRLMPLGGSITQGVGSADGNGYREELVNLLTASNYDVEMLGSRCIGTMEKNSHEGWRGFRVDEIEQKARQSVPKLQPDLFTVNAGSNDCVQNCNLGSMGSRMSRLLEFLWTASPGSTVILSTLVVNRDPKVNTHIISVNDIFRDLVTHKGSEQKRIVLADMYCTSGPSVEDLGVDGTHPGNPGYKKMAVIWHNAIEKAADQGFLKKKQ